MEKSQKDGEHLVKVEMAYDNQFWRNAWGYALVSLPTRDQASVQLPPPPSNPMERPMEPLPEEVRESLHMPESELPFGARFHDRLV